MSITVPSDYQDILAISQNKYDQQDLQKYIDEYEEDYLICMLGKELYDLFISDLDPITNLPTTQRFIDIYNPIYFEGNHNIYDPFYLDCFCHLKPKKTEGIPEMLKEFVYFHYGRDMNVQNTITGYVRADNENSTNVPFTETKGIRVYNKGIYNYNGIIYYIHQNKDVYPEWDGYVKEYTGYIY